MCVSVCVCVCFCESDKNINIIKIYTKFKPACFRHEKPITKKKKRHLRSAYETPSLALPLSLRFDISFRRCLIY